MADISSQARGRVGTGETRTVEGVNRDRSSPEVEGVEEYMHGQPLDPVSSLRKGAACLQTPGSNTGGQHFQRRVSRS